jgi:Protein of unknown function (DUF4242)
MAHFVVERYLPGMSEEALRRELARLNAATAGTAVRNVGSTILAEDEACFCYFEAPSAAAVAEANGRARVARDRIIAAVPVAPSLREMRALLDGVFAHVYDPVAKSSHAAVYRQGSLSLEQLPVPVLAEDERVELEAFPHRLASDWPRLYVLSDLRVVTQLREVVTGTVLWRSGDGGKEWTVTVARALPSRAYRVRGRARVLSRTPLPGGYVASARVGDRLALVIRQLDRTRPQLALPGSAQCTALELRVDWPNIFVQGRRSSSTRAIWLSQEGGYRWTRFAVHRRARSGSC